MGMGHLVSLHFIHRDLAARNLLLAQARKRLTNGRRPTNQGGFEMVTKVADFGLSRGANNTGESEHYYTSSNKVFPIRWTAPEAMETFKFTGASDVWSFAIVVIEMFQNGENPYQGISNPDVMKLTMSGGRHMQPAYCPDNIYAILMQCWDSDPNKRPTFAVLAEQFRIFSAPTVIGSAKEAIQRRKSRRDTMLSNELSLELARSAGNSPRSPRRTDSSATSPSTSTSPYNNTSSTDAGDKLKKASPTSCGPPRATSSGGNVRGGNHYQFEEVKEVPEYDEQNEVR
jgi:serine/threonine protein kinase